MSNPSDEIHQIKSLITSILKPNKSLGYSKLLHFHQHSAHNPSSIQSLAECSHTLICSMVSDIHDEDEEIAAQALKGLGFMIYHPVIVATLPVDDFSLVLESLVKLITTTKLKSACNLGVWCISVQQIDASILATHFHSLLLAIIHAFDNPMGSLSTTFEASQAIIKLASQLSEEMRSSSHIWAPPIYRRLLSTEKKERDATERCLLKIRSTIIPPSLDLSKAIVKDLKKKLLIGMKDLLDQGMKIQVIQAWGWFVRMLGSHALKNRHLVNDMLKIPEITFTDLDYQVQIATQVAWEGLIDSLIDCPVMASQKNTPSEENSLQRQHRLGRRISDTEANGFSKSIKLIMTPLIGVMSSKCDVSVQLSCLNTWCYLLYKLDTFINEAWVIKMVFGPILDAIFKKGLDDKSTWLWNVCLDLLFDSILQKCADGFYQSTNKARPRLSEVGPSLSGKYSWQQHPIKWLPWDISQLDFYLRMISVLIHQASGTTVTCEHRSSVFDAALKLFVYVLKGVKLDLTNLSINYDGIMLCLKSLLTFMNKTCEDLFSNRSENSDLCYISIQFIDATTKELGPSILGSPLYKFALDLKSIDNLQPLDHVKHLNFPSVVLISYMDNVSPLVYLTGLYFHMVGQLTSNSPQFDCNSQGMCEYFKFLFSSSDPLDILLTCVGFLYKQAQPIYLNIWVAVAQGLKDSVHDAKCKSILEAMSDNACYSSTCHLLLYPLVVLSNIPNLEKHPILSEGMPMLELIIQTWKLLYGLLSASGFRCSATINFYEDICSLLTGFLDENAGLLESSTDTNSTGKSAGLGLLYLSGNFMICILEQIQTTKLMSATISSQNGSCSKYSSSIESCLKFSAMYMNLLGTKKIVDPLPGFVSTSRVYSALACFVGGLHRKQDILIFLEIMSSPLLEWLSNMGMRDESTDDQLQLMWTEILGCLKRSQPPINFGSAFLQLYEPLFEKTLDHPHTSISESTIDFWNSTFGQQFVLDFPPNLLPVLDKLSRNRKLKLQKRSLPFLQKCHSHEQTNHAGEYKETPKHNNTSKRVESVLDYRNHLEKKEALVPPLPLNLKRKRLELTEHQKEVKRAQQRRERDAGGHGPGIRTYTNVDFSQGLEDSQESQEVRDSEAILLMLRKDI